MKEVRNLIWVLKPKWKDEDKVKEDYEEEDENVEEVVDKDGKKKDKVVPTFGGAICVDKSGLLLTTVTGLTGSKKPKLRKAMVRARCYRGYFRDVKLVKDSLEDGLALYQVVKKAENEVFEFLDFDEVNDVELTVLDKVFAFVHTGGNFSFRRGILNFPPPPIPPKFPIFRIFKDSSFEKLLPYLNHHLPLLQVSNLGDIMNSGMSGCPVFKMENSEFLGLIAFCTGKFSLVIPLRVIRYFICNSKKRKREDDDDDSNDMKLKKRRGGGGGGGQGRGGKGGGGGGGGGWRGGKGGGGGKGRGQGWRGGKGGGQGWRGGKGGGGGGVYALGVQNVPPAVLVQFLREHRSEWADFSVDAYSAAVLKANTCAFPGIQAMRFSGNQIIMLLGHTIEHEEDNPTNRTLDLTSSPEVGPPTNQGASDATFFRSTHSVLTIVFQLLSFESNLPESDATMARQYVRSVISSVQRVAMAITPPDLTPTVGPKLSPGSPDALILVHWICKTYRRPNDAIGGFSNDGWTLLNCDGAEDVIIAFNAAKLLIATLNGDNLLPVVEVLCAKASMLLQNVPPTVLVRLLREHRSEWADVSVDTYSAAALKANSYAFPRMRATRFSGSSQIFMTLDHTIEHEKDNLTNRTLDLTLSLEVVTTNQGASDAATSGSTRSVLTIAFQLLFDSNLQESIATMANQYVRSVISSVQRVAMAVTPSGLTPTIDPKLSLGSLEALTLVHWICKSYCCHMGIELLQTSSAID